MYVNCIQMYTDVIDKCTCTHTYLYTYISITMFIFVQICINKY